MGSYDYLLIYEAITVDSRFLWRAETREGRYNWKTFDIFKLPARRKPAVT